MRLHALLPLLAALLLPAATTAQGPPPAPAAPAAEPVVVIHAGTLLDRPGRPPRRNASILVRGGRIERGARTASRRSLRAPA